MQSYNLFSKGNNNFSNTSCSKVKIDEKWNIFYNCFIRKNMSADVAQNKQNKTTFYLMMK